MYILSVLDVLSGSASSRTYERGRSDRALISPQISRLSTAGQTPRNMGVQGASADDAALVVVHTAEVFEIVMFPLPFFCFRD